MNPLFCDSSVHAMGHYRSIEPEVDWRDPNITPAERQGDADSILEEYRERGW